MLHQAFGSATEDIYLQTRSDGKLFNLTRLRAKMKVRLRCLHDFLFANDAAVTAHSAEDLQRLMIRFGEACQAFGLLVSLNKTQVMGQGVDSPPDIGIADSKLEVVYDFVYLGSTITDSFSLNTELNKCIGQGDKQQRPGESKNYQHVHNAETETNAMAGDMDLTWHDKVTNNNVLGRTRITSMYTMLKQRRMRWQVIKRIKSY
ncbi:uncharacterized protein [Procambarus clarkii]|uniref:uncharacterized protein n=1 Tax=Procambarus clarkii TaxID=6728 RepID=UPI0037425FD8